MKGKSQGITTSPKYFAYADVKNLGLVNNH